MDFVHKRQKIVNWKYYTRPFIRNIFTYLTEKCEKMLTYTEVIQGGMKICIENILSVGESQKHS